MATDDAGDEEVASPPARRVGRSRWRDPRMWLGILLVVAATGIGSKLFAAADDTIAVWRVTEDLPAGTELTSADLESTRVHFADADSDQYVPADVDPPVGSYLSRDVGAGDLLAMSAISASDGGAEAQLPLGVSSSGMPADLAPGDRVEVWALPEDPTGDGGEARPRLALPDVRVESVGTAGPGGQAAERQVLVAITDDTDVAEVLTAINGASIVLIRLGG